MSMSDGDDDARESFRKHINCYAHELCRVIDSKLLNKASIKETLIRTRSLVHHFANSAPDSKLLEMVQQKTTWVGKPPLKLICDAPDRWLLTYYMLERMITLEDSLVLM